MEEVYVINIRESFLTSRDHLIRLVSKIATTAYRYRCDSIETNGNIAASVANDIRFNCGFSQSYASKKIKGQIFSEIDPYGEEQWIDEEKIDKEYRYRYGSIAGKDFVVNPCMRWSENIVYFRNEEDEILHTLRIEDPDSILL